MFFLHFDHAIAAFKCNFVAVFTKRNFEELSLEENKVFVIGSIDTGNKKWLFLASTAQIKTCFIHKTAKNDTN